MDVFEAIKGRRSIRAFKDADISPETVEKNLLKLLDGHLPPGTSSHGNS